MTLAQQVTTLATRIATEFKTVYGITGDKTALATTAKNTLVAAINEVNSAVSSASGINDAAASTSSTYSSSKIEDLVNAKPSINDSAASGTSTYSSNKIGTEITALINDAAATNVTDKTWSVSKINTSINTAVSGLVDSSPAALDTLNELAAALGDDANFATTTSTALGNRVRVDAAQVFTDPQKVQGRANIGAADAAAVGDTARDFVADFNTALAS